MKLKDLMYFNKLAELRNYTDVAAFYNVKQPTVTMAVQRLETEFNVELINRDHSHHHVKLTPSGKKLEAHAKKIGIQVNQINEEMKTQPAEKIRFGLPPIIGNYYFPKLANELSSTGILDNLSHVESGSNKLLHELKNGKIDIALLGSRKPLDNSEINATILATDQFKIVVANDSPLANLKSINFSQIATHPIISLSEDYVHSNVFKEMCELNSVTPDIKYQTQDIELAKQMAAANVGSAFLVSSAIKPSDKLTTISIDDSGLPPFDVSVAWRKNHVLSQREKELINILKSSIK